MDILNLEKKWSIELMRMKLLCRTLLVEIDKYISFIETIFFWLVILWFVFNIYICYFIILNIINTDARSFIILLQYFTISKKLSIRNFSIIHWIYVDAQFTVINLQ